VADQFTTNFSIRPQNHGKFMERVASGMRRIIKRALTECRSMALKEVQEQTANAIPASDNGAVGAVASGALQKGWTVSIDEPTLTLNLQNPAANRQGDAYTRFIEGDREPGQTMPPPSRILLWLQQRYGKGDKRAAFLIARSIARRGLRRRKIVQSTREGTADKMRKVLYTRFQELIRQSAGK
jgi:hypothetical protein